MRASDRNHNRLDLLPLRNQMTFPLGNIHLQNAMNDAYVYNCPKFLARIICVNPTNTDEQMEFESVEELVAKLFALKAEVERLTKAGDAMADSWLDGIRAVNWEAKDVKELRDWYAAKEGKGHE